MASRKRSFAEFGASNESNLTIVTADGGRIPAHNEVLRLVCKCLQSSPASDTWDLSTMLINGGPVKGEIVTAVLQVIYSNMGALEYEMDTTPGQYSLQQLQEMLLFADAVGCSKRTINQVASLLGVCVKLELVFQLTVDGHSIGTGNGETAAIEAEAASSHAASSTVCMQLNRAYGIRTPRDDDGSEAYALLCWQNDNVADKRPLLKVQAEQLRQQLTSQHESLLLLAFKMDLQQLLDHLLLFLRNNVVCRNSLFMEQEVAAIFSARVAASAGSATGRKLLSWAAERRPLGGGFGIGTMFADPRFHNLDGYAPGRVPGLQCHVAARLSRFCRRDKG